MTSSTAVLSVGDEPAPLRTSRPKCRIAAKTGRFAVLNTFLDLTLRDLDRAAAAVWLLLYRDTKRHGTVRTGQADLARRAGVNVRTVKRAIARLRNQGLLTVVRRGRLRSGPSSYVVHPVPKPP